MSDDPPPIGTMWLFDRVETLRAGTYRVQSSIHPVKGTTELETFSGTAGHFSVDPPRLALGPADIAGVFPPNKGHGAFQHTLPHVALFRHALPWERRTGGSAPWLALLLFEHGEPFELVPDADVAASLPADVVKRLDEKLPTGARATMLRAPVELLRSLCPTIEELPLLTHVRQVNVEDRELAAGDSDGWFAVVTGSRMPLKPDAAYTACIVSLEGWSRPADATSKDAWIVDHPQAHAARRKSLTPAAPANRRQTRPMASRFPTRRAHRPNDIAVVCLHSWTFETVGHGDFRTLCGALDVGFIGESRGAAMPGRDPEGHLQLEMRDRAGERRPAWYRGPLVGDEPESGLRPTVFSADVLRSIIEPGIEDINYAAAFELGRLLAAADARLAQELLRWRSGSFAEEHRRRTRKRIADDLAMDGRLVELRKLFAPRILEILLERFPGGIGPVADLYDLGRIDIERPGVLDGAPGLDLASLAQRPAPGGPIDSGFRELSIARTDLIANLKSLQRRQP